MEGGSDDGIHDFVYLISYLSMSILGNSQSDSYSGNILVISWENYELSTYDYTSWIRFTRIISE